MARGRSVRMPRCAASSRGDPHRVSSPVVCCTCEQRRIGPARGVVAPATGHIDPGYSNREGSERTRRRNLGRRSVTSPSCAMRLKDVQIALLQRALKRLP